MKNEIVEVRYPFVKEEFYGQENGEPFTKMSWRPGTRAEFVAPDDTEDFADGIGLQILTVISRHKPGKFPERIFFTRKWRDPDGHEFGKGKLHIMTAQAFKRRCNGFMHEYKMAEKS